jgi:hypothetical protein
MNHLRATRWWLIAAALSVLVPIAPVVSLVAMTVARAEHACHPSEQAPQDHDRCPIPCCTVAPTVSLAATVTAPAVAPVSPYSSVVENRFPTAFIAAPRLLPFAQAPPLSI